MDPNVYVTTEFPNIDFTRAAEEFAKFPAEKRTIELVCTVFQYRALTHAPDYFQRDAGRLLDENNWRFRGEAQAFARKRFDAELFALTGLKRSVWRDDLHPCLPKSRGLQPAA